MILTFKDKTMRIKYRMITLICMVLCGEVGVSADAIKFNDYFVNKTLRVDYTFSGDVTKQYVYLDELNVIPKWYGKKLNLNKVPLEGNGKIEVRDSATNKLIYLNSFSTLFQEWLTTNESRTNVKSFENVFSVPFPKKTVKITLKLFDIHQQVSACATHIVNPSDILIRHIGEYHVTPYVTLQEALDTARCIHVAYVAEGYTKDQMPQFIADCRKAMDALFRHEPFKSLQYKFNMVAVESPSEDSGISVPRLGIWKNTALGTHFDTFYSERYNTTLHLKKLNDVLAGIPYEHIIIICNTDIYGGGGIYNSYTAANSHAPHFEPVVVHEFGHSFGGLGDEYVSNDPYSNMYPSDTEPWEPNLTTLHHFKGKWGNLIKSGTPCPTPESEDSLTVLNRVGYFEGGGYQSQGVYRGVQNCRMNTNEVQEFCPVCRQTLTRLIEFYTGK